MNHLNDRELRVIGMSRSGNHAIIAWILAQAEGRTCFLNCTEGKTNPFVSCRPLEDGRCDRSSPAVRLDREAAGEVSPKDLLLFSHEDHFLGHARSERFEQHHDRWVGRSRRRLDLLIVRDPFNVFASRRRSGIEHLSPVVARRMWMQHARAARSGRHAARAALPELVPVLYNRWCRDAGYRRALAERLGLRFDDRARQTVPGCNGGSSFDGTRFDGRAERMAVTQRWRAYAADPDYRTLFDRRLVDLALALFPEMDEAAHAVLDEPEPSAV